ncbi:hypothetical protein AB6A40_004732 [Gnathostoma spinigerum]|uniref:Uncharacterized protein n=1 Tax=Gnathostoma spinigerum TaxID=75299 RepID=A0ABD6EDD5_9BILA
MSVDEVRPIPVPRGELPTVERSTRDETRTRRARMMNWIEQLNTTQSSQQGEVNSGSTPVELLSPISKVINCAHQEMIFKMKKKSHPKFNAKKHHKDYVFDSS